MNTSAPGPKGDEIVSILNDFTLNPVSRIRSTHVVDRPDESEWAENTQHNDFEYPQLPDPEFSRIVDTLTEETPATAIRPYAWTGGRTRTKHLLELETLVSTRAYAARSAAVRLEHDSVAELCLEPRSVAEIGALLGVPIGVVKVLLGDMADLGLVSVHDTISTKDGESHLNLMERVLNGLQQL